MAKFVCTVCGYVYEGEAAPEVCPVCKAPASKFKEMDTTMAWAAEHEVGIASDVPEDIKADLRANFEGECSEVGMYLAMARVAHREGYPEIGLYWEKAAYEEAEHAAKFAELQKGFFCQNDSCKFAIWKNNKWWDAKKKQPTKAVVSALLNDGRVRVTGLYSEKTGKTYDAAVVLEDDGQYANFKLEFDQRKGGSR